MRLWLARMVRLRARQTGLGASFLERSSGLTQEERIPSRKLVQLPHRSPVHSTSLSSAECSDFSPPITVILLVFLCLEGLLFFTFTAVMFGTQIHSICNDETEIERLKSEKPTWERRLRWEGMKSVFGGPPSLLWMNPFVGFRFRRLQMRTRKGGPEFSV